ncbi:hypothetical protein IFM89_024018 [Coptis chinensis]|uniref:FAS1 domain-containing protein n=1 Tax=Coptis chinensis TaxID=261450 RepID=A0A835H4V8_9MAGN|nr:hypothetical protein IFM89_024018 [Coptis chinensis]
MASFLDLQLLPIEDQFTVFAPKDVEMKLHLKNFGNHNSIFRRHVVGYKLSLKDLVNLAGDIALPTFSDGFEINVTCSGDILVLNNGIHVVDPDMYTTDRIVVHGIAKMLGLKEEEVRSMVSSEKF